MDARSVRISNRTYGWLLWLLPAAFRREFAEPMRQTFADLCAARLAEAGPRGMAGVWLRAVPDLVGGAAREWASTLARVAGGSTRWPRYAGSALVGGAAALLLLSQALYPANLSRPEYLWAYVGLLAALTGVAVVVLRTRGSAIPAVSLGLATCPLWPLMYTAGPVGILAAFRGANVGVMIVVHGLHIAIVGSVRSGVPAAQVPGAGRVEGEPDASGDVRTVIFARCCAARGAETAGFAALTIADHDHPWNLTQGQSPFVWSMTLRTDHEGNSTEPTGR